MKKTAFMLFAAALLLQGCTRETQSDVKELGHDMGREINAGAQKLDRAVDDAVD